MEAKRFREGGVGCDCQRG